MPYFKNMYITLFKSQTKAISILQEAQIATEDMYIESEPPGITILHPDMQDKNDDDGE